MGAKTRRRLGEPVRADDFEWAVSDFCASRPLLVLRVESPSFARCVISLIGGILLQRPSVQNRKPSLYHLDITPSGATSEKDDFMRVSLVRVFTGALAVLVLTLLAAPSASATSCTGFDLSANNLGLSGSVGCVTVNNSGTNQVTVTITMNAGFSVKLNGGDVAFNGPVGLTLSDASMVSIEAGMFNGMFKSLKNNHEMDGFGKFDFDYANIKGQPGGIVSADMISFTLTGSGLTASQFSTFAIHFCTASGTNCGPKTGFAEGLHTSTIPEPGTMALLGTGVLALAKLAHRRRQDASAEK